MLSFFLDNASVNLKELDLQAQQKAQAPSIERLVSLFESLDTQMNGYLDSRNMRLYIENFIFFKEKGAEARKSAL